MTDTEAAWLAGMVDGEGYCQYRRERKACARSGFIYVAALNISNTSRVLVDRCRELVGGGKIATVRPSGKSGHARIAFIWTIAGKRLTATLLRIRPYVVDKRERVDLLLAARALVRVGARRGETGYQPDTPEEAKKRALLLSALRALNHRGTTSVPTEFVEALATVRAEGLVADILSRSPICDVRS